MPMPLFYYAELTMSRRMSVKEGNKQTKSKQRLLLVTPNSHKYTRYELHFYIYNLSHSNIFIKLYRINLHRF